MLSPRLVRVGVLCAFGAARRRPARRASATAPVPRFAGGRQRPGAPGHHSGAGRPAGRSGRSSSLRCRRCHFETGQRELKLGHLESAKAEFNRALEVLLESPFGGRTEPRIREHFDRLVERISAYEVTALAQGDGFAEQQRSESATIDELLAISTFETPAADAGNDPGGHRGPPGQRPRHRHPA